MKYDHYNNDYDNYFDNDDNYSNNYSNNYSDKQVHTCVDVIFPEKNTTDL